MVLLTFTTGGDSSRENYFGEKEVRRTSLPFLSASTSVWMDSCTRGRTVFSGAVSREIAFGDEESHLHRLGTCCSIPLRKSPCRKSLCPSTPVKTPPWEMLVTAAAVHPIHHQLDLRRGRTPSGAMVGTTSKRLRSHPACLSDAIVRCELCLCFCTYVLFCHQSPTFAMFSALLP